MHLGQDRYVSDYFELRSDRRRRFAFSCPLLFLTICSLATTWRHPRGLVALLLFGLVVGGPILWWGFAHRVEVAGDRFRQRMPLAPWREVSLADVELVDIRPADRLWPFRAYVVTLATRQGEYLPFETANFAGPDVQVFLNALMARAPHAAWTGRAEEILKSGL